MPEGNVTTVNQAELSQRMAEARPDNTDPNEGYALINVLKPEMFEKEHIPASINIPEGNEGQIEQLFSKDKEIVLYCASDKCDASPKVAKRLAEKGFTKVYDYEAGMQDWKENGGAVASGSAVH